MELTIASGWCSTSHSVPSTCWTRWVRGGNVEEGEERESEASVDEVRLGVLVYSMLASLTF